MLDVEKKYHYLLIKPGQDIEIKVFSKDTVEESNLIIDTEKSHFDYLLPPFNREMIIYSDKDEENNKYNFLYLDKIIYGTVLLNPNKMENDIIRKTSIDEINEIKNKLDEIRNDEINTLVKDRISEVGSSKVDEEIKSYIEEYLKNDKIEENKESGK